MNLVGNVIWFLFGGVFAAIGYFVGGLALLLTVVGIPFGLQSCKLGIAVLAPFGREVVELPDANSVVRVIFNVIWLLFFGWEIALSHVFFAIVLAATIVGIPFAVQHIKLIPLCLLPFGRDLR